MFIKLVYITEEFTKWNCMLSWIVLEYSNKRKKLVVGRIEYK